MIAFLCSFIGHYFRAVWKLRYTNKNLIANGNFWTTHFWHSHSHGNHSHFPFPGRCVFHSYSHPRGIPFPCQWFTYWLLLSTVSELSRVALCTSVSTSILYTNLLLELSIIIYIINIIYYYWLTGYCCQHWVSSVVLLSVRQYQPASSTPRRLFYPPSAVTNIQRYYHYYLFTIITIYNSISQSIS